MADLLKPDVLSVFLFYIAPGVVATRVYTFFNRSQQRNYGDLVVEFITFSMFYLTLFFWLIALVNSPDIHSNSLLYNILIFITVFVVPSLLGYISSILLKANWFRKILKTAYHPTPSGWDYAFGDKKVSYWILFNLKTGERIGGLYRGKSFASSYPLPQDIYIEELWKLDDQGRFVGKVDKTAGCFIKVEDCRFIQFFEN